MTELTYAIKFDSSEDTPDAILSAERQNLDLAIGGEYAVEMNVYVNGVKAKVLSSTWRMKGQMIVKDSTRQTLDEGKFKIASNPTVTGGHNGDPALITAAWIQEGVFEVNISGTYQWKGAIKKFDHQGFATIHAPALTAPKGGLGSPDVVISSDRMLISFDTGTLRYTCDEFTSGGQIGFLQLVKGRCFRGRIADCRANSIEVGQIAQTLGAQNQYLDDSAKRDPLFYWQTKAESAGELQTQLEQSILCDEYPKYNWYKAGLFPSWQTKEEAQQPLEFFTYVAYKAKATLGSTKGPQASYVVIRDLLSWSVVVMTCVNPLVGIWEMPASQRLSVSSWGSHPWGMPEWKDCATRMQWKDV